MSRIYRCALLALSGWLVGTQSIAAEFYPLGPGILRGAKAVSPDGATVLTGNSIWTPAGGHVPLLGGNQEIYARDISGNGLIAGMLCGSTTTSCYEAFRSSVDGPPQGLAAFDNAASDAHGITASGQVVVGNASSAVGTQSYRWTEATGLVSLGQPAPDANLPSIAYGVSDDGSVVVGQTGDDLHAEAFRWTQATGMVGLGQLEAGDFTSTAIHVSRDGSAIVGTATSSLGQQAFRWTQVGGMLSLGDLHPAPFQTDATAVSADGATVYGRSVGVGGNAYAWIWTETDGMRKLQDVLVTEFSLADELAGWQLWSIADVSANGLVLAGNGRNPAGGLEGFVVTIPEPSTAALSLLVATTLFVPVLRRRLKQN